MENISSDLMTIIIVTGIINLIALIVFLVMASNIAKIKKYLLDIKFDIEKMNNSVKTIVQNK